jgi:hypothetical protein
MAALETQTVKPKRYEPHGRIQEFAPYCRTFAVRCPAIA